MVNSLNKDEGLSILTRAEIELLEQNVRFHTTRQGTKLAFHEYGDPGGQPLFFYHGTGSHIHGMLLHKPAQHYGLRLIAPDRPGVAQSDFRPGWTILEYARNVADIADALGIGSFGAIGISGGGPTLMASAYAIPERLNCVVDLACAMPLYQDPGMVKHLGAMDRLYAELGTHLPLSLFEIPFSLLGFMQKVMKSPKSFAKMFAASLCQADQELFENPDLQYLFMRDFQELFRHGAEGPAYDAQTVYKDWGFHLADIEIHIEVFQGTADIFIPRQFSEYLGRTAKDVRINFIEDQGHFYHLAYGYQLLEKIKNFLR